MQFLTAGGLRSFPNIRFFSVAAEHPVDIPPGLIISAFHKNFHYLTFYLFFPPILAVKHNTDGTKSNSN